MFQYAEEGARRENHPLITFRDGPTGRRAGLVGGPDVWEVAMWLEDLGTESDPVATLAEGTVLTRSQIDAALRYRAAYPGEIGARIELHRRETAAADTLSGCYSTRRIRPRSPARAGSADGALIAGPRPRVLHCRDRCRSAPNGPLRR